MVGVRTPGIDCHRVRRADDRNDSVLTVRDGRIVALRDGRDRRKALDVTGTGGRHRSRTGPSRSISRT
jgi:hypothetical protein